jgi:lipopolysaccharide/colanic/teichoic acid biosynthesis glycosyltransferase
VSVNEALTADQPVSPPDEVAPGQLLDLVDNRTRELIEKRRGNVRRRGWLVRRALAAADATGVLLAFALTQALFPPDVEPQYDRFSTNVEIVLFALTLPFWVVLGRVYNLYSSDEERTDHSTVDDFTGVFNMLTVGAWLFFALAYVFDFANPSFPKLALFWLLAITLVPVGRTIARALCRRSDTYVLNTLIVGAGHVGQRVARKLLQHPEYKVNIVGFVDEHPRERIDGLAHLAVVGRPSELPELVSGLDVDRVIVAFSHWSHGETLEMVRALNQQGVQVDIVPRLFEALGPHATVHAAEGLTLIGLPPAHLSRSSLLLKRAMDISLSLVGILVLFPAFLVVAAAIKLDSRGPVLFRQVRMGRETEVPHPQAPNHGRDAEAHKGEVAHLNKHAGADDRMFKAPNDPRVTRVGRLLRRYSIDELPQLANVLRGEMSLVGPRPLIPEEHRHVDGWGLRRLDLKPGITGLWQVLGRDDVALGEMVELDHRNVTTWSLFGDRLCCARSCRASGAGGSR